MKDGYDEVRCPGTKGTGPDGQDEHCGYLLGHVKPGEKLQGEGQCSECMAREMNRGQKVDIAALLGSLSPQNLAQLKALFAPPAEEESDEIPTKKIERRVA